MIETTQIPEKNNVLVLGNGFDIAHGYRTRYEDFFNFYEAIDKTLKDIPFESIRFVDEFIKNYDTEGTKDISIKRIGTKICEYYTSHNDIREKYEQNSWIKLIKDYKDHLGRNWADLEMFIGVAMNCLAILERYFKGDYAAYEFDLHRLLYEYFEKEISKIDKEKPDAIFDLTDNYKKDLDGLIELLSIYLYYFQPENDLEESHFHFYSSYYSKVLSFNYTNHFKEKYDVQKHKEYHFIHGKCDDYKTMVFGTDEEIKSEIKGRENEYLDFQKYYQRIIKETGSYYKRWLNNKCDHILFFGFSFSLSDMDTILSLSNNRWIISYYNDSAKKEIVRNLSTILSKEVLIERIGNKEIILINGLGDTKYKNYMIDLENKVRKEEEENDKLKERQEEDDMMFNYN
ncbi:MAG: hypothetical protein IKE50_02695 [Erysipelotrichaceae bacterium]|nr:hypothetical protein [Erysipelotrichaceae bacterium]